MIKVNGKYYSDIWYEVFVSDIEGTYSVDSCNTLKEAKKLRKDLIREGKNVYIDKWGATIASKGYESEKIEDCLI